MSLLVDTESPDSYVKQSAVLLTLFNRLLSKKERSLKSDLGTVRFDMLINYDKKINKIYNIKIMFYQNRFILRIDPNRWILKNAFSFRNNMFITTNFKEKTDG